VTIDGVWIGDSIYSPFLHSRLVTTLYRSLTHTDYCPQSITVSLNYTLQISHIKFSLHYPPSSKPRLVYNFSLRTSQKTQLFHCCNPNVALLSPAYQRALFRCLFRGRCLEMSVVLVYLFISWSLHSNGCARYNMLQHHLNNGPQFYSGNRENAFAEHQDVYVCVYVYIFPHNISCVLFTLSVL
jgi:hypothetical protein